MTLQNKLESAGLRLPVQQLHLWWAVCYSATTWLT